MKFFTRLFLSSISVIIATYLLPGVRIIGENSIDVFLTSVVVALIISFLNVTIKPILIILTIPITVITLGLFLLFINAIVVVISEALVPNFQVDGIFWALIFSLVLSLVNLFLGNRSSQK